MQIAVWKFGCHSAHSAIESHGELCIPKGILGDNVKNEAAARSCFAFLVAIALAVGSLSCGVCGRPFIGSISPSSAIAGGNQFVLSVNGSDFRRDSLMIWNGSFLVTGFVNTHQLVVPISAADIAQPGSVLVFVLNPADGSTTSVSGAIGNVFVTGCAARDSNAVTFTITRDPTPERGQCSASLLVTKIWKLLSHICDRNFWRATNLWNRLRQVAN